MTASIIPFPKSGLWSVRRACVWLSLTEHSSVTGRVMRSRQSWCRLIVPVEALESGKGPR